MGKTWVKVVNILKSGKNLISWEKLMNLSPIADKALFNAFSQRGLPVSTKRVAAFQSGSPTVDYGSPVGPPISTYKCKTPPTNGSRYILL